MSYLPPHLQRSQTHDRIVEALAVAYRRGLTVPADITAAKAMRDAVENLTAPAAVPAPVLPTKPADLAAAIAKVAAARSQHEHAQKVAAELQPLAQERFVDTIRTVMASWVAPVVDIFAEHLTAFRAAATDAPHVNADQLAGLDPASFSAWQVAQSAAYALEADVEDRRTLAAALGENYTSNIFGDYLALVAVVTPPQGEMTDALNRTARERVPVLQQISCGAPTPYMSEGAGTPPLQGVDRWRALLNAEAHGWLRLDLAGTGQAAARLQLVDAWADVVPHLTADSQNQGGSLTRDLLDRAAQAHRTLTPA